jgi:hypothetical protein
LVSWFGDGEDDTQQKTPSELRFVFSEPALS